MDPRTLEKKYEDSRSASSSRDDWGDGNNAKTYGTRNTVCGNDDNDTNQIVGNCTSNMTAVMNRALGTSNGNRRGRVT